MDLSDCFALLDDATGEDRSRLYRDCAGLLSCRSIDDWPALLGAMHRALDGGLYAVPLLTYELGNALQGIASRAADAPLARVLLFRDCATLTRDQVGAWLAARTDDAPAGIANVHTTVDEAAFTDAIARIHHYIEAGHTYQVNYTYRVRFDAFGSLIGLYARLRARQPVPFGALIALPDGSGVLSLSPELFITKQGDALEARPMKGTAPAGDNDADNARRAATLALDPKNRAENLMIVDLLRNDLGRICDTGSVSVPALFDVTRFASVLQMTSTVRGTLRADATLAEIFSALYPCGSITGAPKRRTMEIIREVETAPRGIYTGAIGWFDPPAVAGAVGDFCLSVPIRTLALSALSHGVRKGELGVGAGIVYDSVAADEFLECQLKASFLTGMRNEFELFETLAGARNAERHLERLAASARYFGYPFDAPTARAALVGATGRVRLALAPDGEISVRSAPLTPLAEPVNVLIAAQRVHSDELFLRHKSSVRARYDAAWRAAEAQGAFDALFFNERDELCEGGRSNVFVKLDGCWWTPPLSCGLLPGVMRAQLLADPAWNAQERVITRDMLARAEEVVVCNALRGPLRSRVV